MAWSFAAAIALISLTTSRNTAAFADPASSQPAVAKTGAATLPDIAKLLDLRTFPMLKESKVFYRTVCKVGYRLAEPNLKSDVAFYRDKLTAAGWKVESQDVDESKSYGCLKFIKGGFCVSVDIVKDPNEGHMQAFVENYGNVDARSLLRPAGVPLTQSAFNSSIYCAPDKPGELAKRLKEDFKKLGWHSGYDYGGRADGKTGDSYYLHFLSNAARLNVHITESEGKTQVMYHTCLSPWALPVDPGITSDVEMIEEPFVRFFYPTKTPAKDVQDFYRRELSAMGWKVAEKSDSAKDGTTTLMLEGPSKESLRLETLEKNKVTFVLLASKGM